MKENQIANTIINKQGCLEFLEFGNFKKYSSIITHCFTTRNGGVSTGECSSLNLGFKRKDKAENVLENFKIISNALKIDYRNMVLSNQVHDSKIKVVGKEDRGKGIVRESDIIGYDALVTDKEEVALVTFYADCVPVFLFDPEKRVIALVHSGWRGTVKEISRETIKLMEARFGCNPERLEAVIGPSIGSCCFEVDSEVHSEFIRAIPYSENFCTEAENGKWKIDLKSIIRFSMNESGVNLNNICISNYCTKCNNDMFFSHRGEKGKTGNLAAIMQINPAPEDN